LTGLFTLFYNTATIRHVKTTAGALMRLSKIIVIFLIAFSQNSFADEASRKENYEKGLKYYQLGQFDEAAKYLELFIAEEPGSDEVLRRLNESSSMTLVKMQRVDKLKGIANRILSIPGIQKKQKRLDDERIMELVRDVERRKYSRTGRAMRATWDAQKKLKLVGGPAIPYLLDYLGDERENVLRSVVYQTIAMIDEKAVLPLLKGLEHPNELIRLNVIHLLGTIGDSRAVPTLKKMYETDKSPIILEALEDSLVKITGYMPANIPEARLLYLKQATDYLHQHPRVMKQLSDKDLVWNFDQESKKINRTEIPHYIWHLEQAEDACYAALDCKGEVEDRDILALMAIIYFSQLEVIDSLIHKNKMNNETDDALVQHRKNLEKASIFGPLFGPHILNDALHIALSDNDSGLVQRINKALVAVHADFSGSKE
jgi:tetratricopeptide (TPR) repeat protein